MTSETKVTKFLQKLSERLYTTRKHFALSQSEMAEKLGLGIARYNEFEKQRNISLEFGCSVVLLMKLAELENIPLIDLLQQLTTEKKDSINELWGHIPNELRSKFMKYHCDANAFRESIQLIVDTHLLNEDERLELLISVQKNLLKRKGISENESKLRREKIYHLMEALMKISR